jgi:hypothetical protein
LQKTKTKKYFFFIFLPSQKLLSGKGENFLEKVFFSKKAFSFFFFDEKKRKTEYHRFLKDFSILFLYEKKNRKKEKAFFVWHLFYFMST